MKPVFTWVGGKRQLLDTIAPLFPKKITTYCEPFVGGGAVLFSLQPKTAYVNDINSDLILAYTVIRDDVDGLIDELRAYPNNKEFFYSIRDSEPASAVKNAARMLYLNKTCYHGLYRVNKAGKFNTPFGYRKNPNIVNEPGLREISAYFNSADIRFSSVDYADVLKNITDGFVYLDPPYDSAFASYAKNRFTKNDQVRLRECCDSLTERGVKFMLSNSATDFIMTQYSAYNIEIVKAKRSIRHEYAAEAVIRNYF